MKLYMIFFLILTFLYSPTNLYSQKEINSPQEPNMSSLIAIGAGADMGMIGLKYALRHEKSRFIWCFAISPEGVVPQIQYTLPDFGNFYFYTGIFGSYNHWEGIIHSSKSVVLGGTLGIQRWLYKENQGVSTYLNFGFNTSKQVKGSSEGGSDGDLRVGIGFQIGLTF